MKAKLERIILKPELVFVIIATIFGLLSMVFMPILAAPDENQHFQVEYAMLSSNKTAPKDLIFSEDMILNIVRDGGYKNLFTQKTAAQHDGFAINTGSHVFDGKTPASIFDITRLAQAIGVAAGRLIYPSVGVMVLAGRLMTLAAYVSCLYFIIKYIKYGKWTIVVISTLPIAIQQAASLSYDYINIVAILAWFAFMLNIFVQRTAITKKQIAIGALLIILLTITRQSNLLLTLLIFALPARLVTGTALYKKVNASRYWFAIKILFSIVLACVFIGGVYVVYQKLLAGHQLNIYRLIHVLMNTFVWDDHTLIDATVNGMVGMFSNFYYRLPIWAVIVAFATLLLVVLGEKLPGVSKRFAIISGSLFFGSILLISIGMYYAWAMLPARLGAGAEVTDGIQGRYFTPLLVFMFPVAAYAQKHLKFVVDKRQTIPLIVTCVSVFLLVFYIVLTWRFFWH